MRGVRIILLVVTLIAPLLLGSASSARSHLTRVVVTTHEPRIVPSHDNHGTLHHQPGFDGDERAEYDFGRYVAGVNEPCEFTRSRYPFFVFDLSQVQRGSVARATLVLKQYQTINPVDVDLQVLPLNVDGEALMRHEVDPLTLAESIVHSTVGDVHTLSAESTVNPDRLLRLRLNRDIVGAVNQSAGDYLTLALNPSFHGACEFDQHFLFNDSTSAGKQRLILQVAN